MSELIFKILSVTDLINQGKQYTHQNHLFDFNSKMKNQLLSQ